MAIYGYTFGSLFQQSLDKTKMFISHMLQLIRHAQLRIELCQAGEVQHLAMHPMQSGPGDAGNVNCAFFFVRAQAQEVSFDDAEVT